jgi:hypothetical protein
VLTAGAAVGGRKRCFIHFSNMSPHAGHWPRWAMLSLADGDPHLGQVAYTVKY